MKKKIIIMIFAIIMFCVLYLIFSHFIENDDSEIITAVKKDENGEQISYIIEEKNRELIKITKQIKCESKGQAENEKQKYETINEFEYRGIGIELKGKTLILLIPQSYFEDEIGYQEYDKITQVEANGEQKELINIEKVKELLQNQGYTIK